MHVTPLPRVAPLPIGDAEVEALGAGRIVVRDGPLGPQHARSVRHASLALFRDGALHPAGVGRGVRDDSIRGDAIAWLDEDRHPGLQPVFALMTRLGEALNRTAYLGLRAFDLQLAVYAAQRGYLRHVDTPRYSRRRIVTAIYYANPWQLGDGGELEVFDGEGSTLVAPISDRLVVFLSDRVEHAVRTVHRGPRIALTAWFGRLEP